MDNKLQWFAEHGVKLNRLNKHGTLWETSDGLTFGAQLPLDSLEVYQSLPNEIQVQVVAQSPPFQDNVLCVVRAPTGFIPLVEEGEMVAEALISLLQPICTHGKIQMGDWALTRDGIWFDTKERVAKVMPPLVPKAWVTSADDDSITRDSLCKFIERLPRILKEHDALSLLLSEFSTPLGGSQRRGGVKSYQYPVLQCLQRARERLAQDEEPEPPVKKATPTKNTTLTLANAARQVIQLQTEEASLAKSFQQLEQRILEQERRCTVTSCTVKELEGALVAMPCADLLRLFETRDPSTVERPGSIERLSAAKTIRDEANVTLRQLQERRQELLHGFRAHKERRREAIALLAKMSGSGSSLSVDELLLLCKVTKEGKK